MNIKGILLSILFFALSMFFLWWGGVDILERNPAVSYFAFCALVLSIGGGIFLSEL